MSTSGSFPSYAIVVIIETICILMTFAKINLKNAKGKKEKDTIVDCFQNDLAFVANREQSPAMAFHIGKKFILKYPTLNAEIAQNL